METYLSAKSKIMFKYPDCNVAFSTDGWTSPNNISFLGITASYLTKDFKPVDVVLGIRKLPGEQSGINLAECFYGLVKEYNLQDKVN